MISHTFCSTTRVVALASALSAGASLIPTEAFARACAQESANGKHYSNKARNQAIQIGSGQAVRDVIGHLSSKDMSNVLHHLNDLYLRQLRMNGDVLQLHANEALQNIQRTLRNGRSVSQRQIRRFPSAYQSVIKKLVRTGGIQNYGLSLGMMTSQFIADAKRRETNSGRILDLEKWDSLTQSIMTEALQACEIKKQASHEKRSGRALDQTLRKMERSLARGFREGRSIARSFIDGLIEGDVFLRRMPSVVFDRRYTTYNLSCRAPDMSRRSYSSSREILNDICSTWGNTRALMPKLNRMSDTQASWYLTELPTFPLDYPDWAGVPDLRKTNPQAYNAYAATDAVRKQVVNHLNSRGSLYKAVLNGRLEHRREEAASLALRDPAIPKGLKRAAQEGLRHGSWQIFSALAAQAQIIALRKLEDPDINAINKSIGVRMRAMVKMIERKTGYDFDQDPAFRKINYIMPYLPLDTYGGQQRAEAMLKTGRAPA